jgi:hypothetical protein
VSLYSSLARIYSSLARTRLHARRRKLTARRSFDIIAISEWLTTAFLLLFVASTGYEFDCGVSLGAVCIPAAANVESAV